jgi:hypothetical protein
LLAHRWPLQLTRHTSRAQIAQSDWFSDNFAHPDPNVAHLHESEMLAMSHGWPINPVGTPLLTSPEMPLVV